MKEIVSEIKLLKPSKKDLIKFGVLIGGILIILGLLFKSHAIFYLGAALFLLGISLPNLIRSFYLLWMGLGITLGWFVTRFILSIIFFLVVTPIGWVLKLINKDPLNLELNLSSYWYNKIESKSGPKQYENQY